MIVELGESWPRLLPTTVGSRKIVFIFKFYVRKSLLKSSFVLESLKDCSISSRILYTNLVFKLSVLNISIFASPFVNLFSERF